MMRIPIFQRTLVPKVFLFLTGLCLACSSLASPWPEHQEDLSDIQLIIYKLEQELDELVGKKNSTRDHSRREEVVQRIIEIRSELIGQRKKLDNIRMHLQASHPDLKINIDDFDSRSSGSRASGRPPSRIGSQLDDLLMKIRRKYASFIRPEAKKKSQAMMEFEKVVEKKQKVKKEHDAKTYLRRKSKVTLEK